MIKRHKAITLTLTITVAATALASPGVSRADSAYPSSMAATGDSITRAYDVSWAGAYQDNPQYSWSTGTDSLVNSQYSRLVALNPAIAGHAFNDARTGSRMSDLDRQMRLAARQHVDYVTVLMGDNDVCTPTIGAMTPTGMFEREFRRAMTDLTNSDPGARVFVSSMPDIYQVWALQHTDANATAAWRTYRTCQSMLSASNTEAQRQHVVAQEKSDNAALARVCAEFSSCRWDGLATYNAKFTLADVSTVDYYHPSATGQASLAAITWASGYWGS